MATAKASGGSGIPHEVRTATEPRQQALYPVRLSRITRVNPTVRLLRLSIPSSLAGEWDNEKQIFAHQSRPPLHFLPGQWLDVHIPSIPQAGGFTITSTPADASFQYPLQQRHLNDADKEVSQQQEPYIELAVQHSPSNPPAKWLWRPEPEILGTELRVRVGGSFVWPPPSPLMMESIKKVVFVAGGVGINPIVSILSHIYQLQNSTSLPASTQIHLLYSTRLPESFTSKTESSTHLDQILFLPRIRRLISSYREEQRQNPSTQTIFPPDLQLFVTNSNPAQARDATSTVAGVSQETVRDMKLYNRRITLDDLQEVVDDVDPEVRERTVCYVCGPPRMTDEFVDALQSMVEGGKDAENRVFFEKWW